MAVELGSAFGKIVIDASGVKAGLDEATGALSGIQDTLSGVGRSMTGKVTVPLVAAGVGAIKMGMDYESAFTGVAKTTEGLFDPLGQLTELGTTLRQGFLDMSTDIPVVATDLAGIGEAAGQLGIDAENILDFTETIAMLGVTTNLATDEATLSLAQFGNVTGMLQEDYDRLGSVVVELGNNMATTERDIVAMGQRIAGAGTIVGMTEADIMALAATLSSVGIEVQAGGSAISRVLIDMAQAVAEGGEDLEAFAAVAGVSAEDFATAFETDPAMALASFIGGLGDIEEAGGNVFGVLDDLELGEIRVRDALLKTASAEGVLVEAIEMGRGAWEENIALQEEAALRFATSESEWIMFMNTLKKFMITVGTPLIEDFFKPLVETLTEALGWLMQQDPAWINFALAIGGVLAVAGPLMMGLGAMLPILGALLSPIGLVVGAIALLGVAFATNFGGIRDVTTEVFGKVRRVVESVISFVAPFIREQLGFVTSWVKENWPLIQETISTVMEAVRSVVETVVGAIAQFWQEHGDRIMAIVSSVWTIVKTVIETTIKVILGIIKAIMQIITGDWEGAWETIKGVFETVWDAIVLIATTYVQLLWDTLALIWETLQPKLAQTWDAVKLKVEEIWGAIVTTLLGWFGDLKRGAVALKDKIVGAIEGMRDGIKKPIEKVEEFLGNIKSAINSVKSAAQKLISKIGALIGKIGELARAAIPSWLRGRSPPPLADWLSDIVEQAGAATTAMAGLGSGMGGLPAVGMQSAPVLAGAGSAAGMGGGPGLDSRAFGQALGEVMPVPVNVYVERVGDEVDVEDMAYRIAEVLNWRKR